MGKLAEYLEDYLKNTPKEVLKKRWEELSYLDDMGPTIDEYVENIERVHGIKIRRDRDGKDI